MDITIFPGELKGTVQAIPSKSQAHRLMICAALADKPTKLICSDTNQDIEATADCLNALGSCIQHTADGYKITPIDRLPHHAVLNCCESGSTLRFMLPLAGALGVDAVFKMEGRLPFRPLSPLWEEMERMGCILSRPTEDSIRCRGKLKNGNFTIPGNISSQYITGLLLSLPLLQGASQIQITGILESKPYVDLTLQTLSLFGLDCDKLYIPGNRKYCSPGSLTVEGDWSNGAFFLAAHALGNDVTVTNLSPNSVQGDRAVEAIFPALCENITIPVSDIPDLVPILAVVAANFNGAVFTNIQRLRLKESDRVASVLSMITALGGNAEATKDTLTIYGTGLTGGTVDSANDHRIAMAAAIASTVCKSPVTILGARCVQKSYPKFWEEFSRLGGMYEFNLR